MRIKFLFLMAGIGLGSLATAHGMHAPADHASLSHIIAHHWPWAGLALLVAVSAIHRYRRR